MVNSDEADDDVAEDFVRDQTNIDTDNENEDE